MADIVLYFTSGSSDKEYRLQLLHSHNQWSVAFQYGRRGGASNGGFKVRDTTEQKARQVYEKYIREKVREGYTLHVSGEPHTTTVEEAVTAAYGNTAVAEANGAAVHHVDRDPTNNSGVNVRQMDRALQASYQGDLVMRDAEEQAGLTFSPRRVPDPEPELVEVQSTRRILWSGRPKAVENSPIPQTAQNAQPLLSMQPNPVEEDEADTYLEDDEWGMQEKYNGKHIAVRVVDGVGQAFNKKGESSTPTYGPVAIPQTIMNDILATGKDLEVDGELLGQRYVVYDILKYGRSDLRDETYKERYAILNSQHLGYDRLEFGQTVSVAPLYGGSRAKLGRFNAIKQANGEGVVFKRLEATYTAGKAHRDMVKIKFYATCSCIVTEGREGKRSVGLKLRGPDPYGGFQDCSVGNVTISNKMVNGQLIEVPPVGSVVEIRYLYAHRGGSLYQPTYLGIRDDVSPSECLMSQLKYKPED